MLKRLMNEVRLGPFGDYLKRTKDRMWFSRDDGTPSDYFVRHLDLRVGTYSQRAVANGVRQQFVGNPTEGRAPQRKEARPTKFGVIWVSGVNIGDDIQALAAINALKHCGVDESEIILIDRERLSAYNGPPVKLIMNGWYTTNKEMFVPPAHVSPAMISFHLQDDRLIDRYIDFFKAQGPIGCRDQWTVDCLQKRGIDAYFTGCLTLTFDKSSAPRNGGYSVDLNPKCNQGACRGNDLTDLQRLHVISHDAFQGGNRALFSRPRRRLQVAQELLAKYRNAELVVTSRLHCALPCRAFNTDVVFLHKHITSDPRFGGLLPYLHGYDGGEKGSKIDVSYRKGNPEFVDEKKAELLSRVQAIVDDVRKAG